MSSRHTVVAEETIEVDEQSSTPNTTISHINEESGKTLFLNPRITLDCDNILNDIDRDISLSYSQLHDELYTDVYSQLESGNVISVDDTVNIPHDMDSQNEFVDLYLSDPPEPTDENEINNADTGDKIYEFIIPILKWLFPTTDKQLFYHSIVAVSTLVLLQIFVLIAFLFM